MFRIGLTFAGVLAVAGMSAAASPDPKDLAIPPAELARAKELVRRLGSADYRDREAAQGELAKMGRLALPVLAEASANDANAEVRSRVARLLPRAEAEDLQARIDTFLADTELAYEHDLPGWEEFRVASRAEWRFIGVTLATDRELEKVARKVYIELLDTAANRNLMNAIDGPPNDLGAMVALRKMELYEARLARAGQPVRQPTPSDLLALLFAESQVSSRYVPNVRRNVPVTTLISYAGGYTVFNGDDDRSRVYRAVAARWIDTRDEPMAMSQAISVATSLNLPEHGCRVAVRLLLDRRATPTYRANAAVSLVRLDARHHLAELESVMNDTTVVYARPVNSNLPFDDVQLRDVVLAASLALTRQNLADYGFISRSGAPATGWSVTSYLQWAFPAGGCLTTYTYRAVAFNKWREWRLANPAME